jgi:hypothetical protein
MGFDSFTGGSRLSGGFVDFKPLPPDDRCRHPEHKPPGMIVLPEGVHTYRCPGCGEKTIITIRRPTL